MIEFLTRRKSCTDLGVGEYDEDSPEGVGYFGGEQLSRGGLVDHPVPHTEVEPGSLALLVKTPWCRNGSDSKFEFAQKYRPALDCCFQS